MARTPKKGKYHTIGPKDGLLKQSAYTAPEDKSQHRDPMLKKLRQNSYNQSVLEAHCQSLGVNLPPNTGGKRDYMESLRVAIVDHLLQNYEPVVGKGTHTAKAQRLAQATTHAGPSNAPDPGDDDDNGSSDSSSDKGSDDEDGDGIEGKGKGKAKAKGDSNNSSNKSSDDADDSGTKGKGKGKGKANGDGDPQEGTADGARETVAHVEETGNGHPDTRQQAPENGGEALESSHEKPPPKSDNRPGTRHPQTAPMPFHSPRPSRSPKPEDRLSSFVVGGLDIKPWHSKANEDVFNALSAIQKATHREATEEDKARRYRDAMDALLNAVRILGSSLQGIYEGDRDVMPPSLGAAAPSLNDPHEPAPRNNDPIMAPAFRNQKDRDFAFRADWPDRYDRAVCEGSESMRLPNWTRTRAPTWSDFREAYVDERRGIDSRVYVQKIRDDDDDAEADQDTRDGKWKALYLTDTADPLEDDSKRRRDFYDQHMKKELIGYGRRGWQSGCLPAELARRRLVHHEDEPYANVENGETGTLPCDPDDEREHLKAQNSTMVLLNYEIEGALRRFGGGILPRLGEIVRGHQENYHQDDGGHVGNGSDEFLLPPNKTLSPLPNSNIVRKAPVTRKSKSSDSSESRDDSEDDDDDDSDDDDSDVDDSDVDDSDDDDSDDDDSDDNNDKRHANRNKDNEVKHPNTAAKSGGATDADHEQHLKKRGRGHAGSQSSDTPVETVERDDETSPQKRRKTGHAETQEHAEVVARPKKRENARTRRRQRNRKSTESAEKEDDERPAKRRKQNTPPERSSGARQRSVRFSEPPDPEEVDGRRGQQPAEEQPRQLRSSRSNSAQSSSSHSPRNSGSSGKRGAPGNNGANGNNGAAR